MAAGEGLLKRHNEIRQALSFFLQSWYKHKQIGAVPEPSRVMFDYVKFRSYKDVIAKLSTPEPQVVRKEVEKRPRGREPREAGRPGRQQQQQQ